jgi:NADH-quinone oxidoreductase subunit A
MGGYTPVAVVFLLGVAGVVVLYAAHRLLVQESPTTVLPFMSGRVPQEHALSRFHARWYAATLLFLAFDVEMLFMYPWSVVVTATGLGSVVEMFIFLGVLLVGVLWAWREGALRWA